MNITTDVASLAARVEQLERAAKRSRITTVALLIAFIAVASVATVTAQSAATQTMQHLKIVDANGVDRVDIDADGIGIAGPSGVYRQVLGVDAKTSVPFYEMRAEDKSVRISINGDPTGPFLRLRDNTGAERVYLGMTTGNTSLLQFNNTAGQKQVIIEGDGRSPYLSIYDNGTKKFFAGIYDDTFAGGIHTYKADGTSNWYSP